MYSLHRIIVSIFFIFLLPASYGGNPYIRPIGAGEAGMGSVCVMKPGFWSSFQNQALLARNQPFSFGIAYENRFNLMELGTRSAALILPAGSSALGLSYSHFGYSGFRRSAVNVACGIQAGKNFSAGIQIDYFSEKTTGDYGNCQSVTFEAGLFFRPVENVSVGIHLFNPVPNSLRQIPMPSTINAGAGIDLGNLLFAGVEMEMSSGEKLVIRTGFEYQVFKKILLRGGFSSENSSFSFGLGCHIRRVRLDLSFKTHEKLGITSLASFIFNIR